MGQRYVHIKPRNNTDVIREGKTIKMSHGVQYAAMTSRQHFLTTGCATAPYPTSSSGSPEVVRGDDVSKVSRLEQGRLWRERFAALSGLAHRGTHSRGEATFIPRTRPEMWAAPNPELGPTKVDAEWMGEEVDAAAG